MKQKTATLGRPREFDRDAALQIAMKLFHQHGFEGVSISDLTQAMNISPPSLYAAFGSKADLYREALVSYQRHKNQLQIENAGCFQDRLHAMLRDTVRAVTEPGYPAGCMVVAGMLSCAAENQSLAGTLTDLRMAQCEGFADQIRKGIADGDLAPDTDVETLSRYLTAIVQGIAIQAKDGATKDELLALADLTMAQFAASPWPQKQLKIAR